VRVARRDVLCGHQQPRDLARDPHLRPQLQVGLVDELEAVHARAGLAAGVVAVVQEREEARPRALRPVGVRRQPVLGRLAALAGVEVLRPVGPPREAVGHQEHAEPERVGERDLLVERA
jgi:hypothetical protein